MELTGTTEATIDAEPGVVFGALTDVRRLPEWNDRIEQLESPAGPLTVGDTWRVRIHLPGKRFTSVSEVLELDEARRRFVHRSKPDDGNPSHTVWTWQVAGDGPGRSRVRVDWTLHSMTLGRVLAHRMRRRMIPKEAAASLSRLAEMCKETSDA